MTEDTHAPTPDHRLPDPDPADALRGELTDLGANARAILAEADR